jgi:chromosome segregation ATPase
VPTTPAKSAVLDPDYAAEVERHTARGQARYEVAQRRMKRAEARLDRLRSRPKKATRKELAAAEAELELRRRELLELQAVMQSAPASSAHRGRDSYRPVPVTDRTL